MSKVASRIIVLTLLTLTSALQGWPLLVQATCNMAAPQMMSQGRDCCCCENSLNSSSPAIASCSPGKSLVGILATDASLLPGNDKTGKFLLQELAVAPIVDLLPPALSSPPSVFFAGELNLPHTLATPLYLVDCTFRI